MTRWGQPEVDELPPWALRCPNGHTKWQAINGHFWCRSCAEGHWKTDGTFEKVENADTGELLDREDVRELEMQAQRQRATAD